MKTVKSLKKALTRVFNQYIRLRDAHLPCISCGKHKDSYHAGHYYTAGSQWASLRYDETNVNKQCNRCNTFLEGNKQGYRDGIIKKYGMGVEDLLKAKIAMGNPIWGVFEYEQLIKLYKGKVKKIEST